MNDWIESAKLECYQLTQKFLKLKDFIGSDKYFELDQQMRDLLILQYYHMRGYREALINRIDYAEGRYVC